MHIHIHKQTSRHGPYHKTTPPTKINTGLHMLWFRGVHNIDGIAGIAAANLWIRGTRVVGPVIPIDRDGIPQVERWITPLRLRRNASISAVRGLIRVAYCPWWHWPDEPAGYGRVESVPFLGRWPACVLRCHFAVLLRIAEMARDGCCNDEQKKLRYGDAHSGYQDDLPRPE